VHWRRKKRRADDRRDECPLHKIPTVKQSEQASFALASTHPRPLRVLVADDERDTVLSLLVLLRGEGYEAKGVYRGAQVLDSLKSFDPDVVLVDIAMPDLSGLEVARAIREVCSAGRPTLIAISGRFKRAGDRIPSRLAGFDHHLGKPYDIRTLLGLLFSHKAAGG
jgi:DNA-binding response OmpR family regulator